ncbi:hypothetical protein ACFQZX_11315 [Mucilaginibacter litoreus]|uniref:Uncharacterized protein n=1 Tax=Mucilaginibacter litoreus TaxID=1048221 RepID=A0ABW3ATN0_9SPHI
MKKVFYLLLSVVAISIYSCQKENTAPSLKGISAIKKDTTPPDFLKSAPSTSKKDTTPPDFRKATATKSKKDTTPPDFLKSAPSTSKKDTTPPDFRK